MKLEDAVTGNIYQPSPPPASFPPSQRDDSAGGAIEPLAQSEPATVDDEDQDPGGWLDLGPPPDERGVVAAGVDPGPMQRLVTTGVEAVRNDLAAGAGVIRDVIATAPGDALAIGRTAVGVSRAVGDRVFAGVPDVDDLADMGARKLTNAAASATRGGALANGWARFGKYRTRWEA